MSLPRKYMVEKRVCGTCVHYRQHYVRTEQGNYYPLWYGHCIHPWRRHPEPDFGCERWEGTENGKEPSQYMSTRNGRVLTGQRFKIKIYRGI